MTTQQHLAVLEQKLQAARTHLILDRPFLGTLVLRLPLVAASGDWCKTVATDARALYYNEDYIRALRSSELQFVLAHEALHCALGHFARRGSRNKLRWDIACDYAINPMLIDEGLTPPPDALVFDDYRGMTAEDIYPCISDNPDQDTFDQHLYDDGASGGGRGEEQSDAEQDKPGNITSATSAAYPAQQHNTPLAQKPPPLLREERETLQQQWQQRLIGAAQQALQAGKLSGDLARQVEIAVQPTLPWRNLLTHYVSANARDDYSYQRPSHRRGGPAIFPGVHGQQLEVAAVIDSSGSLSDREISEFLAEINAIKSHYRARVLLIACDRELADGCPWVFEPWEDLLLPASIHGGGGTCFTPVFDYFSRQGSPPDVLLYFTDGHGNTPKLPPNYPVLWLIKGSNSVPWGQRIQLN